MAATPAHLQEREPLQSELSYFSPTLDKRRSGTQELLIPPHRIPGQGRRRWEFDLGGLLWVLRLNERQVDKSLEGLRANGSVPVQILVLDDRELVDRPGVIDIAVNMFREEYLQKQRAGNSQ